MQRSELHAILQMWPNQSFRQPQHDFITFILSAPLMKASTYHLSSSVATFRELWTHPKIPAPKSFKCPSHLLQIFLFDLSKCDISHSLGLNSIYNFSSHISNDLYFGKPFFTVHNCQFLNYLQTYKSAQLHFIHDI